MSTYSLQRTNPRLASNIKLVVTDDKMYLETIDSNEQLSRSIYKAYDYNENLDWGTNVKNFARQFSNKDLLYDIVDEKRFDVTDKTELQFHQLYDWGTYSDASKLIDANYRCFAPLHLSEDSTDRPDAFVVMKISQKDSNVNGSFSKLSDYINTGKIVKVFELDKLKRALSTIKQSSIDMRYSNGTLTTGLSLDTGLMTTKEESMIEAMLANESTLTEFENQLALNFREHSLVYSNIVNVEFAFNDTVDGKFVRYVGFYVNYNETTAEIANEYENTGALRLYRKADGLHKYSNNLQLSTYDVVRRSQFAVGFGLQKAPQIKIVIDLNPVPGSEMKILYNGIDEHVIRFDTSNIGLNVNATAEFIANELTANYEGSYSTIYAFVEDGNKVVIRSNMNASQYENLSVAVPLGLNVIQPKFIAENYSYNNTFVGSSKRTVILNTYYNPTVYNKLQYIDSAGNKIISSINLVTEYQGDFLYHLEDEIVNTSEEPNNVWFVETVDEIPIICSVLQHRDLDVDTTTSVYDDVLDFDISMYKEYLLAIVNSPSFRGRADAVYDSNHPGVPASSSEVEEYKTILIEYINKYFDSINLNRSYLFENIDLSTEEATTTNNEYERLAENSIPELTEVNRLYKQFTKWSYIAGNDVYAADYRANIALPFRFDSFTPSLETVNRDIRYHTHSWLIIGEGKNPYIEINEKNIRKCLSYSRLPLTKALLKSNEVDAYDYLQYETNVRKYASYSYLRWNKEQEACYTFFRGAMLRFDDKTLSDYKFAAIMLTQEPVQDDVLKMQYIRNDKYKTLTLVVNFYIPDPILTSLEQGSQFYFLDRSLLYFSDNIYSTGLESIDFGTDRISLTLYNNTTPKTYLGNVVTNDWIYQTGGQTLLHVSRGDLSIFNTPLNEIMTVGQDFTIDFTEISEDTANPGYGMQITFANIQEVSSNHFWCTQILVKTIDTHDPDGTDDLDINDNIVDSVVVHDVYQLYLADPQLFWHQNIPYISRAIALENCTYKKVVNAISNNARYRELSAANILTLMKSTDVALVNNQGASSYLRVGVVEPTKTQIIVSMYNDNGVLKRLDNKYLFPIVRYDGKFMPATIVLNEFDSDDRFERIFATDFVASNRYKLNISRLNSNLHRVDNYKESLIRDVKREDFFEYYANSTANAEVSKVALPWISNPIEWRSFTSIVLNTAEELQYAVIANETNDLKELLYEHVKQYCPISDFALTSDLKEKMLKLKYDASQLTTPNYNVEREIVGNFVSSTFIKLYELQSVQLQDDTFVNFIVDDSILTILDSIEPGTKLKLNFKR